MTHYFKFTLSTSLNIFTLPVLPFRHYLGRNKYWLIYSYYSIHK